MNSKNATCAYSRDTHLMCYCMSNEHKRVHVSPNDVTAPMCHDAGLCRSEREHVTLGLGLGSVRFRDFGEII